MLDTTCCATLRHITQHVALDYLSAKAILKHKKRILGLREMLDTTCCATLRHVALDYLSAKNILKHLEYECCDFARWIRHVTQTYDMPRSIICERKLFCNTRNTNTRTSRDVRYDMLRNLTTCRARFVV